MKKTPSAPIAYAGPSRVTGVTMIKLSGSESLYADSFNWSLVSKPRNSCAMLNNTSVDKPTLIADVNGDYIVELTVSNKSGESAPARITITVSNDADMYPVSGTLSIH